MVKNLDNLLCVLLLTKVHFSNHTICFAENFKRMSDHMNRKSEATSRYRFRPCNCLSPITVSGSSIRTILSLYKNSRETKS